MYAHYIATVNILILITQLWNTYSCLIVYSLFATSVKAAHVDNASH